MAAIVRSDVKRSRVKWVLAGIVLWSGADYAVPGEVNRW